MRHLWPNGVLALQTRPYSARSHVYMPQCPDSFLGSPELKKKKKKKGILKSFLKYEITFGLFVKARINPEPIKHI